jgi:transposase-like protein
MQKRRRDRNPLFAERWFSDDVIITCVRWNLRFRLSYRDLASIAAELGIAVAPSTILRWVVRYAEEFARRWEPFELTVGRSWRADETYIKVNGG